MTTSTEAGQWMGPTLVVMSWDTTMSPQVVSWCMPLRGKLRHHLPTSLGNAPGDDQEEEKDNDVEEITEEDSTRLAFEAELETTENQEPMDVAEEIPTAHAAVTAPKEEQGDNPPEQKTPELKALGVTEGETPEKVSMPGTFTKAITPMHPNKYIDLASDDDDPSGVAGSETTTTAVKLEVKTESQPCALLGALMSTEPRVMDKKDKCVVTSGLKIMQHEDDVMKAMVEATSVPESVHMLVLRDPTQLVQLE